MFSNPEEIPVFSVLVMQFSTEKNHYNGVYFSSYFIYHRLEQKTTICSLSDTKIHLFSLNKCSLVVVDIFHQSKAG